MSVAAIAGVLIPVILKKSDIDPAVAGGVILTTVTDVVGLLTFLRLGHSGAVVTGDYAQKLTHNLSTANTPL